jgi:hypothetical protein
MKIHKYGITLTRVKEKDIELIREKRNSEEVKATMHFRETITESQQKEWFKSINNVYNNYFLIETDMKPIGLINGKDIQYDIRTSEGGMFIWDKNYLGTIHSALSSIIMSDFNFIINEFEKNYIRILRSNEKAIGHNKLLGYVPATDRDNSGELQWFVLTKENYLRHRQKLSKVIKFNTGDSNPLTVDDFEFRDDTEKEFDELYSPLPEYLKKKINYCLRRDGIPPLTSTD